MPSEPFRPDDIVKTCSKLESGLNLAIDGLRACTRGAYLPPLFCSPEEINQGMVTKDFIIEKRKDYIRMLNDDNSIMDCKNYLMVEKRRYGDLSFSGLDHLDLQHYSMCNLRCSYCAYTRNNLRLRPQYNALVVLNLFSPEDVTWNAHVDFAGGEPTLLKNIEEYLEFFRNMRIRVMMHTNGVLFNQAIYNGLADGSISWVTTSVDAGTPSTFKALRGKDKYLHVLENLTRYAVAGGKGKGMLAVKYIFTDSNCSDDDIAGFAYAMLAIRPQQVWLTFDFTPLYLHQEDHNYTGQIEAYAKLYVLLKKHGIEAFHYYKENIATVSKKGRKIMDMVLAAIERQSSKASLGVSDLLLGNFRSNEPVFEKQPDTFSLRPLRLTPQGGSSQEWSIEGKRVLLVPACPQTLELLSDPDIQRASWIGFVDRNPIQQGKIIHGSTIYSYEEISSLNVDVILTAPPEKHRHDILHAVTSNAPSGVQIAEFQSC